jgi:predicted nucleic acid-binding Zn ribbon protein
VCPGCGCLFLKRAHGYRKFCNDICRARVRAPHRVRECVVCGKEFLTVFVQQKYCTRSCSDKAAKERKKPKTPGPVKCLVCNKEFIPRSKMHKYCSKECKTIMGNIKKREYRKKRLNK